MYLYGENTFRNAKSLQAFNISNSCLVVAGHVSTCVNESDAALLSTNCLNHVTLACEWAAGLSCSDAQAG